MTRFSIRMLGAALACGLALAAGGASAEMIGERAYAAGAEGFWASGGVTLTRKDGEICANVPAGGQAWDRLAGINDLRLTPGTAYRLRLTLTSKWEAQLPVLVQQQDAPYTAQAHFRAATGPDGVVLDRRFAATDAAPAQVLLHLGGALSPWTFCLSGVSMTEDPTAPSTAATGAGAIRVNQAGYFTDGPKRATILSESEAPLEFTLVDGTGRAVGRGATEPMGHDPSVDAGTHVADFTPFRTEGEGYRIVLGKEASLPFAIGGDTYARLRVDALSWFYPQRSGIEIRGDIAGEAYARPAGHVGVAPNRGDTDVTCLKGAAARTLFGSQRGCSYSLDVSGGWYDAGDQGKYVVNGGISVAQLMAAFERGLVYGGASSPVLSDGLSRIPEAGNGIPDILDEARWELDFLMRMMVPDGQPLAGMVHHKVHDSRWTGTPMLPHLDPEERVLHRPSTAATLNLAAAAAQGARLFAPYDRAYARTLLAAAERAFRAAEENPILQAPVSDGLQGGGDYNDDDISDETYWAAAELFITTGDTRYLAAAKNTRHWAGPVFSPIGAFDWRSVAGLARIELALFAKQLAGEDAELVRGSVISAARTFLSLQDAEPFGHIYRPAGGRYDWGSNQLILQNMVVVAAAYDLTGEKPFLDGVRQSMDYLLGRNLMNLSYITGYGTTWSKNQHSRWYANQVDPSLPHPPNGSLAGGPNSTLVDDVARAKLQGCVPQACYVDDIMAWGSNEITINWNAPLVYIASFLADTR
ncbi:glycoside hydrolase family 9 protein [Ensifer soli]|uniref:glycoside hydrolase family 9 protein n=1 Tax=Ciceribacter sp. sgz301302 TaxID=3342379 RepID=UPI0035B97CF2